MLILFLLQTVPVAYADQDPTAPLGWTQPEVRKPVTQKKVRRRPQVPALQSIICKQPDACSAVLNDTLLSQGDSILGYRVIAITNEKVTLKRGGRMWALELFPVDIKHERLQK
ncbi:MSHA biogenesis protein MshK [Vibrio albus]|uniref:MSHA biogenesis protein MshK n=2 Tax=Vibrio albus TaxID=2200953 RepID=A0A2U3B5H3_9VIBR|nr:MSHA biogenesis protein MshK [Vibrio albus]